MKTKRKHRRSIMRYYVHKEMAKFGTSGDVIFEGPTFYYFPKSKMIKSEESLYHNFKLNKLRVFDVEVGDVIEVGDFKLIIRSGMSIEMKGTFQTSFVDTDTLVTNYPDYPLYTNSPRIKMQATDAKVELERIPDKEKDTSGSSLAKKLIPALVGIVMAVLMLWVRPRGIRGILMLITTLVSFAITMYSLITDRRASKLHNQLRKSAYENYLYNKRHELAILKIAELEAANYNYLELDKLLVELDCKSSRLYERDIVDADFLNLRIGTQTTQPTYRINNPFEKLELRYEQADKQLRNLYDEYKEIANMPLVIDAKHNIGLVGNRYVISKQMKNILMQLIFNHSPIDLQIIVITDDGHLDDYKYAFSMGHFRDDDHERTYFVHDVVTRDQFLSGFTQVLRKRDLDYKQDVINDKHYIFIIDNPALISNHPIREFFEKPEERLGISQIYVAKTSNELPKQIRTTIEFKNQQLATLVLADGLLVNKDFTLPKVEISRTELELYYHRLSNLEHVKGVKSSLPEQLNFLEMYGVQSVSQLNISTRWDTNKTYKSLSAPIGRKSETDNIYLDLHEKVHGPHGLIAGTTGSGKSEVIQSYILSLAIEYSPEQVGFLLIDYKGGGMANLFKDLPHHLGSITNLDGYQSMRALASIKSELRRRQLIFSNNNVNHINNYTKLFETGKVTEPLPHLFIISDEFAELKVEQPDFIKELVSAARIGRSLGIHLILATQKPDGVVDDQIWSNSKFKLCLKVAEESDSKAMLKTTDAAYITNPGRGYLKVGNNELYELFQSGYSGAEFKELHEIEFDPEMYIIDIYGNQTLINPEECIIEKSINGIAQTELEVVIDEINRTYQQASLTPVRKPWLPPLADFMVGERAIALNTKIAKLEWSIGLIDIPDQQRQQDYKINLNETGHLLICGISGMGKTKALANSILRLAEVNSPKYLKFYILDFANGGLAQMQTLNHTADYILDYETDKLSRFIKLLKSEMRGRRNLFKQELVTDIAMLDQSKYSIPRIVIVIDGYAKINEVEVELLDEIITMIRDSSSLGIHFIFSAITFKEVKENIKQYIPNRVMLFSNDKHEVTDSIGRTEYAMQEVPGRAFVKLEKPEIMQLYYPIDTYESYHYSAKVMATIKQINEETNFQNDAIKEMPDVVEYNLTQSDGTRFYAGISYDDISDFNMPLDNTLIIGEPKRGKTNFLTLILEQSINLFSNVLIIDSLKQELAQYRLSSNVTYFGEINSIANINTDIVYDAIIINKVDLLEQLQAKEMKLICDNLGMQMLTGSKVFMEIGENITNGNRLFKQIKKATNIVIMQSLSTQRIITVQNPKLRNTPLPDNSAFISVDRQLSLVKIPKTEVSVEFKNEKRDSLQFVKKQTNMININRNPIKIQNMTICNSLGDLAISKALDAIITTDYNVVTNLDEKYTKSRENIEKITSYRNFKPANKTILVLDIKNLNEVERNIRLEFIDKLEHNDCTDFYIWLVTFGERKISNKYLKSIIKNRYALLSGGFENNPLYQATTIRNMNNESRSANLVLMDKTRINIIEEGE